MCKPRFAVLALCTLVCLAGPALANKAVDGDKPAMMVSPSTVVLAKVDTITVHTNIALAAVDIGSIALQGVVPTAVFADDCGHLVGKFAVADLGLEPGKATLTLLGCFQDGTGFAASDVVRVK